MTLKKRIFLSILTVSILIVVTIGIFNFIQLKTNLDKEIVTNFQRIHSLYKTFEDFEISRLKESADSETLMKVDSGMCSRKFKIYDITEEGTVVGFYVSRNKECYLVYSHLNNILNLVKLVEDVDWMIIYDKKFIGDILKEYGIQDSYIKDRYVFKDVLIEETSDPEIMDLTRYRDIDGYTVVGEFPNKKFIMDIPILVRGEIPAGKIIIVKDLASLYQSYIWEFGKLTVYNFVLTFLISLIVYLTIRRVVSGIELIKDTAESFQRGDFSKIETLEKEIAREKNRDEIYMLKHSILLMGEKLKDLIEEIRTERDKLQEIAYIDHLTGLYNRRFFFEHIKLIIENAKRYGNIFTLIVFDIDNFKHINDNYGHDVGDSVLKEFADILKSNVRSSDIVSRFGGEEFIVVLQNSDGESGLQVAERIRKIFEQKRFRVNDKYINTTVSGGISTYREGVEDIDTLIKEADIALYKAKRSGKNRIVVYRPGMESEDSAEEGGIQGGTSKGS